jgi:hypothetical protein
MTSQSDREIIQAAYADELKRLFAAMLDPANAKAGLVEDFKDNVKRLRSYHAAALELLEQELAE